MWGAIKRGANAVYRGADRVAGGYLPGAHRPNHEMIMDYGGQAVDAGIEGVNTAFDIVSGNRDRRFNKYMADLADERNRDLIRDKAGLEMEGLAAAGINPTLAGSGFQGGIPAAPAPGHSGSNPNFSGAINSAASAMSSIVGLRRMLSELPMMEAQARKTNADAHFVEASTEDNLQLLKLRIPEVEANTARSVADRKKIQAETFLRQLEQGKYKAEKKFYDKHGMAALGALHFGGLGKLGGAAFGDLLGYLDDDDTGTGGKERDAAGATAKAVEHALNTSLDLSAKTLEHAARQQAKQVRSRRNAPISGSHYMTWGR